MSESRTDEALMLAYRAGDAWAFELLYSRHKGPLYRYLLRQCRLAHVAEELFQEVWLNLIRARDRYEVRAKFSTYLFTVAHNRLIDYFRRQAAGVPLSYADDPDDPIWHRIPAVAALEPEQRVELGRQATRMLNLVEQLPEAQREAFLLREEAGLSLEELAAATGVNAETAKSRLRYAVAKLRQGMGEEMASLKGTRRGKRSGSTKRVDDRSNRHKDGRAGE